jgi:hypothetical protein
MTRVFWEHICVCGGGGGGGEWSHTCRLFSQMKANAELSWVDSKT